MYSNNIRLRHAVIICLVLTLVAGCKTTGSRTLADEEGQQQSSKRKWGTIALLVIGAGAAAVGGVALVKRLRAKGGSEFDKMVDRYLTLMKKEAENPGDEKIAKELGEVGKELNNMFAKAGSDEAEKLEADFVAKKEALINDPSFRELEIKNLEEELLKLQAGELDEEMKADLFKQFPNPRDTYQSFDEYLEVTTAALRKHMTDGADFNLGDAQVEEVRRLWDNYDEVISEALELAKNSIKNLTQERIDELRNLQ